MSKDQYHQRENYIDFPSFEGLYAKIVFSLHAHNKHLYSICSFEKKKKQIKNKNDEEEINQTGPTV